MTLQSTIERNDYVGTGAVSTYSYVFYIIASTDLVVYVINTTTGQQFTLVNGVDYTVTGAGLSGGGSITLVNPTYGPLPNNWKLAIVRARPETQLLSLRNQAPYSPQSVEDAFDGLTMMVQALNDAISHAIGLPMGENPASYTTQLPTASVRAGGFVSFDSNGNVIISPGTATGGYLQQDLANTLSERNGLNAMAFRIFNTYTSATNFEDMEITWQAFANQCVIWTNQGSGGGSPRALNFGVGGVPFWSIDASGNGNLLALSDNRSSIGASGASRPKSIWVGTSFLAPSAGSGVPTYAFADDTTSGIQRFSTDGSINFIYGGTARWCYYSGAIELASGESLAWSSTTTPSATPDTILVRDSAAILALKNGTNAQTFRVYGTTSGSAYAYIGHDGTNANLNNSSGTLNLGRAGVAYWSINLSGHWIANTDNSNDIGTSGAVRPRNIYAGTQYLGASATGNSAPVFSFATHPTSGMWDDLGGFGGVAITCAATLTAEFLPGGLALGGGALEFGASFAGAQDIFLTRDAAGTLAQRNGTNPQGLNLYNTYTNSSNNEFAQFIWSGNTFVLQTQANGTGTFRNMTWNAAGGTLTFQTAGNARLTVTSTNWNPGSDNAITVGTSALRLVTVNASTQFNVWVAASDANPGAQLSSGQLALGVGGATALDTILVRDAAAILALKNSTNAQTFRIYGTTTGPKYLSLSHNGTDGLIDTAASSGKLLLGTNATQINFNSNIGTSINPVTDASFSIGTSSLRWANIVAGTAHTVYQANGDANPVTSIGNASNGIQMGNGGSSALDFQIQRATYSAGPGLQLNLSGAITAGIADYTLFQINPTFTGSFTVTRLNYLEFFNYNTGGSTITDAPAFQFNAAPGTHKALAANGSVAVTVTSLGPTGAQTTIQGWIKVNVAGTLRYIPFF